MVPPTLVVGGGFGAAQQRLRCTAAGEAGVEMADAPAPRAFLIADDHPMVRDALKAALGQAFESATIALAGTLVVGARLLQRPPIVSNPLRGNGTIAFGLKDIATRP